LHSKLPPRPFLAIVDPELAPVVRRERGPTTEFPLRFRQRWKPPPELPTDRPVRRLTPEDRRALRALAEADGTSVTDTYLSIDLHHEWVVGGFEGEELIAVARAEVRLAKVWHVSGVFTATAARNRGWGRAVVAQLLRDAGDSGAGTALFVREGNLAARALYDGLGFDEGVRRVWVDAGAGRSP
jgi:GNAT superfamily N-acetyltransferase